LTANPHTQGQPSPEETLSGATIVFDLDGTLVDSAPDLLRALNQVMDLEGMAHAPESAVRRFVGHGARVLIEKASAQQGVRYKDERLDQLTAAFIDFYRADIAGATRLYPHMDEALRALVAAGGRLAVCTNKRHDLAIQLLDALSISGRFAAIVGADAVANRKPHPGHFIETVSRAGGDVTRAIMVGDSTTDVRSAQGAGAPAIVYRHGYADMPHEDMGADALLDDYALLEATVRKLLART
jgi:phosphoglycolate phosphatase